MSAGIWNAGNNTSLVNSTKQFSGDYVGFARSPNMSKRDQYPCKTLIEKHFGRTINRAELESLSKQSNNITTNNWYRQNPGGCLFDGLHLYPGIIVPHSQTHRKTLSRSEYIKNALEKGEAFLNKEDDIKLYKDKVVNNQREVFIGDLLPFTDRDYIIYGNIANPSEDEEFPWLKPYFFNRYQYKQNKTTYNDFQEIEAFNNRIDKLYSKKYEEILTHFIKNCQYYYLIKKKILNIDSKKETGIKHYFGTIESPEYEILYDILLENNVNVKINKDYNIFIKWIKAPNMEDYCYIHTIIVYRVKENRVKASTIDDGVLATKHILDRSN